MIAAVAAVLGESLVVFAGANLAAVVFGGHRFLPVGLGDSGHALVHLLFHPELPQAAWPASTGSLLPGPGLYWVATVLVQAVALIAALFLSRHLRPIPIGHWPTMARRPGMATMAEVRRQLSPAAVRHHLEEIGRAPLPKAPAEDYSLYLGYCGGVRVSGRIEDSYALTAPPRAGKDTTLIIPNIIWYPGAVITTSTRIDTLAATIGARSKRGPVYVYDPQRLAPSVPHARWSLINGCEVAQVAMIRAAGLATGAGVHQGTVADSEHWQAACAAVIRCHLHAAALAGLGSHKLLEWGRFPGSSEAEEILWAHEDVAAPGWGDELASVRLAEARYRDSVWAAVRRAYDCLADPRVLEVTDGRDGEGSFDVEEFIEQKGTLYILAARDTGVSVSPILTALVEDVLYRVRAMASKEGGRLVSPLMVMLNEIANTARLSRLPNLLAEGGGMNVTTWAVFQSEAQARELYGEYGAQAIMDVATVKILLGGTKQESSLASISRLAGDFDEEVRTISTGPGGKSVSTTPRRMPVLPVNYLSQLPRGVGVVLTSRTAPVQVKLPSWSDLAIGDEVNVSIHRYNKDHKPPRGTI